MGVHQMMFVASAAAGAVEFVGATQSTDTNGGSGTVSLTGLGLQQGDLVVAYHAEADTATDNISKMSITTSGYSTKFEDARDFGSETANLRVATKVMGATPDSSISFSGSGDSSSGCVYGVIAFRGASDAVLRGSSATDSGNRTPGSITVANAGSAALAIVAQGYNGSIGSISAGYDHSGINRGADSQDLDLSYGVFLDCAAGGRSFLSHNQADIGGTAILTQFEITPA